MRKNSKTIDKNTASPYNSLCREKAKENILRDIVIDLQICKLEGTCHRQYITEVKTLIDSVYMQICKDH